MKTTRPSSWLLGGALFVALLFLAIYMQPDRNLESPDRERTVEQ